VLSRDDRWRLPVGALLLGVALGLACEGGDDDGRCGPSSAVVARVIDGDTIELADGQRVRYLMIDTPEITNGKMDCFGAEARDFNRGLVEGKTVDLSYDVECEDKYDRLLAYVSLDGRELNSLMVERGYACVLRIPPTGEDRADECAELADAAMAGMVGLWGACEEVTCD
jgi:micrococcal nuclease